MYWKDADVYGELLEMIQYYLVHEDIKIVHGYVKNIVRAARKRPVSGQCTWCNKLYRRISIPNDGFWHEVMGAPIRCHDQTRPVSEQLAKLGGAR